MKVWICLLVLAFVTSAFAQAQAKEPSTEEVRRSVIWDAAYNRLSDQSDLWFDDGDFPRIIQSLRFAYALYPNDYEVATNLGWMLQNIELHNEAIVVYTSFRRQNPNDPDASWPEANFWFRQGAYAKIPPILEPSIRLAQKPHPNTFRTLAHSYDRLKLFSDSVRVWRALIKLTPDDLTAKRNLERVEGKMRQAGGRAR